MNIEELINKKISGFYDIGKEYSLDLYTTSKENKEKLQKILPKNKNITIIEMEEGFKLRSFQITNILNFQKNKGLKIPLEHI